MFCYFCLILFTPCRIKESRYIFPLDFSRIKREKPNGFQYDE